MSAQGCATRTLPGTSGTAAAAGAAGDRGAAAAAVDLGRPMAVAAGRPPAPNRAVPIPHPR